MRILFVVGIRHKVSFLIASLQHGLMATGSKWIEIEKNDTQLKPLTRVNPSIKYA